MEPQYQCNSGYEPKILIQNFKIIIITWKLMEAKIHSICLMTHWMKLAGHYHKAGHELISPLDCNYSQAIPLGLILFKAPLLVSSFDPNRPNGGLTTLDSTRYTFTDFSLARNIGFEFIYITTTTYLQKLLKIML